MTKWWYCTKGGVKLKDDRLLPVDEREPVDDYDDYLEDSDEMDMGAEGDELELYPNGRKTGRDTLFIAS